jgi:hypothetical protein
VADFISQTVIKCGDLILFSSENAVIFVVFENFRSILEARAVPGVILIAFVSYSSYSHDYQTISS